MIALVCFFYRRAYARTLLALFTLLCASCDRFPRDQHGTLEKVMERNALRVGAIDNRPWAMNPADKDVKPHPRGVEVALVEAFARDLGVEVSWHFDVAQNQFDALERYELDMVVGGVVASNPWAGRVAFTLPYMSVAYVVAVRDDAGELTDLDEVEVAIRPDSGLSPLLRSRGARVTMSEHLARVEGPVALASWELRNFSDRTAALELKKEHHVMAIPNGENALLMRLENFLLHQPGARIEQALWEQTQQ